MTVRRRPNSVLTPNVHPACTCTATGLHRLGLARERRSIWSFLSGLAQEGNFHELSPTRRSMAATKHLKMLHPVVRAKFIRTTKHSLIYLLTACAFLTR